MLCLILDPVWWANGNYLRLLGISPLVRFASPTIALIQALTCVFRVFYGQRILEYATMGCDKYLHFLLVGSYKEDANPLIHCCVPAATNTKSMFSGPI